jgi:hypothetical protein
MGEANSATVKSVKKSVLGPMTGMRKSKALIVIVIVIAPSTCSIVITHVASYDGKVVSIDQS